MSLKRIPAVEMLENTELKVAPPEGYYAVIIFTGVFAHTRLQFPIPNPFPVITVRYKFSNGQCDELGNGSNVAEELAKHDYNKIYVVGFSRERRRELDKMLADAGIELVTEVVDETD
jgi:hypothetical protein